MPVFMIFALRPERIDADALALLRCLFEPYLSVNQGEQGVVASYSDVAAGLDHRAALAHQNRASPHHRAVATFDAEPLTLAVTTVARAADAFLVCHVCIYASSVCRGPGCSVCCSSGGGPASPADGGSSVSTVAAPVSAGALATPARPAPGLGAGASSATGSAGVVGARAVE